MSEAKLTLVGLNGQFKGKTWMVKSGARIGRVDGMDVLIDDNSVSRNHAEIVHQHDGWKVHDLGSTNGIVVNGEKRKAGYWPIHTRDSLQLGEISLMVQAIDGEAPRQDFFLDQSGENFNIHATQVLGWEEASKSLPELGTREPRVGEKMLALIQASHHLSRIENQDELLRLVLQDAVSVLDAQRGAIALLNPKNGALEVRAISSGPTHASRSTKKPSGSRTIYSHTLAERCLKKSESILFSNVESAEPNSEGSISEGRMASVLCVLLRTPRKALGILHLDRGPFQNPFNKDDLVLADAMAAQISSGIECSMLLSKQRELFINTVTVLAQAVELRDVYTGGHTQRVTAMALMLANELGLGEKEISLVRTGTPLHDIGKIGIDDAILRKPGRLTAEEAEIMKQHTTKGAAIVELVPDLIDIIPIVRSHHERWDGRGYPDGLKNTEIALIARVVSLADSFDAMTSDRPYRKGMEFSLAFEEIAQGAGTQFDPTLVGSFLKLRQEITNYISNTPRTG